MGGTTGADLEVFQGEVVEETTGCCPESEL